MVVYGDSHAAMWFAALSTLALKSHWKILDLAKGDCPANGLSYSDPPGWGSPDREYSPCDQWHRFAIKWIDQLHPDLVVITQEIRPRSNGVQYTPRRWQQGLALTIKQLMMPKSSVVVLGNIPALPQDGPECLARSDTNIQACSGPSRKSTFTKYNQAERAAAEQVGARYVSVTPWFCSMTCTAVIGRYEVYWDQYHIDATYSLVLERVLQQALRLPAAA